MSPQDTKMLFELKEKYAHALDRIAHLEALKRPMIQYEKVNEAIKAWEEVARFYMGQIMAQIAAIELGLEPAENADSAKEENQ